MKETNRNVVLTTGTIMLVFLGLIYAWSIFRGPLTAIFTEWTRTQISMTFTISISFFCIGGFVAGKLAAKIRHRYIIVISAIFILFGFSMITLLLDPNNSTKSLIVLYIFYGVFSGGGVGLSYNTLLGVVASHFPGKTGLASGILLLGFGIGGLALGTLAEFFTASIGVKYTFLALGIILAIVLLVGSFFINAKAQAAPVKKEDNTPDETIKSYTLKEAISSPSFWMIFLWVVFLCIGGLLIINSAAQITLHYGASAIMGLIVAVFNGVGRPIIGFTHDRIGRNKSMILNTAILFTGGIMLLLGDLFGSIIFICIGLPLMGISYGGAPTLLSAVIRNFYGPKNYQVILATSTFSLAVAAIIGPLISSKLQDMDNGGFQTTFIMLLIVGLCAFVIDFLLAKFSKKEGLEKAS